IAICRAKVVESRPRRRRRIRGERCKQVHCQRDQHYSDAKTGAHRPALYREYLVMRCPHGPLDSVLHPVKRATASPTKDHKLETNKRSKTEAAALDRMKVDVVDALRGFAGQARRVVIGDVVGLAVEDVEDVEA